MKDKHFILVVLSIAIAFISIISALIWMTIARDLSDKVGILEQEIMGYKWQLEQVNYICEVRE